MGFTIRPARVSEFAGLGEMAAAVYAALPGMPTPAEQPDYYARLRDVAARASHPAIEVFAAIGDAGAPLGCVDYIAEMSAYGAAAPVAAYTDAAGIRLLAVSPASRGNGVGKALTQHCLDVARSRGKRQVLLHTTRSMETAWGMYERLGFTRFSAIDFAQGRLEIFGFRLALI